MITTVLRSLDKVPTKFKLLMISQYSQCRSSINYVTVPRERERLQNLYMILFQGVTKFAPPSLTCRKPLVQTPSNETEIRCSSISKFLRRFSSARKNIFLTRARERIFPLSDFNDENNNFPWNMESDFSLIHREKLLSELLTKLNNMRNQTIWPLPIASFFQDLLCEDSAIFRRGNTACSMIGEKEAM